MKKSRDGFKWANEWLKNPINRRGFLRFMGIGAATLAGGGLTNLATPHLASAASAAKPKYGGTIRLAWLSNLDTLDPHRTSNLTAIKIHNNVYNGILRTTFDGKRVGFEPELAREWEIRGETEHIFHLRKGIKFHNGDDFTAQDVKWSWERVKNPEHSPVHAWKMSHVTKIEVIDDFTIKMVLDAPDPFMTVAQTGSTGRAGTILNRRAVEAGGKEYGSKIVIGTGAFKFVEWKENDSVTLERNPNYWEKDADGNQLPYLDKVIVKIIIEESTAVAAMMAGEIDGMDRAPFQFVETLRKNPKITVYTMVGGNYVRMLMNNVKPPFDNKTLRQAASFAINRDEIVKQVFFGEAIPAHGPISPPMSDYYDPEFETGKNGQYYDLEKAKELIKQTPYASGAKAEYVLTSASWTPRLGQVLQAQLAKIGVKVELNTMELASWWRRFFAGEFDLTHDSPWADLDPDETMYPEYRSGEKWNPMKYHNPEADKLLDLARSTLNVKTRREAYHKVMRILAEDAPAA
ncbi:MAG: ABC transporter substrate-binding protein, partial [Candidatus Tectomicrobia bacterium]|nr:ABC transporter substrate-binding protein [Candidatus Tectomicrobia bacterium]